MTIVQDLRDRLCRSFCADLLVNEVPSGLAISARYDDDVGDPIACYVESDADGWTLFDDGSFLPDLAASGIDPRSHNRAAFIGRVLAPAGAFVDDHNLSVRTATTSEMPSADTILNFLLALVRMRDVSFWNQERVRTTFKDDAYTALVERLGQRFNVERNASVRSDLREFPADVIITPKEGGRVSAVYFASGVEALNEALLLWQMVNQGFLIPPRVLAILEDGQRFNLSAPKVQRAINRIDGFSVWTNDQEGSVAKIARMAAAA